MRNLKLTLAYDGTRYHGFQDQGDAKVPTVQRSVESAWKRLTGESVRITGAGRTDAGVHAKGQVANLRTESPSIPEERVPHALNSVLADDIRVIGCERVPDAFHARYDARSKVYVYRIQNGPFPSPLERLYTYFVHQPLDVEAMAQGGAHLVGRHDFRAFAGSQSASRSTERTMFRLEVDREEDIITFTLEADGFLYHMVRTIVGSLLVVGRGEKEPGWVREVLESKDRAKAGATLPGRGLVLEAVRY